MEVLGVVGSLRRDSHNRRLMQVASGMLPPGTSFSEYAAVKRIPPFDEDDERDPGPAVIDWRDAIEAADAVLFATPEYNGSIPGHLKNAIDWASRPVGSAALLGKPVAVIGASQSPYGAIWAQAELRKVLATAGARVVELELPVPSAHEAFENDGLADRETSVALSEVLVELLLAAQQRQASQVTH